MSIELCNRQLATVHFAPGPAAHLPIDVVVVVVVAVVLKCIEGKSVPKVANIIIIIIIIIIIQS